MNKILLILLIISNSAFAGNYLDDNLKKLNWNDIEVVWLEDDTFPTYNFTVYFHAGALTDSKKKQGVTEFMFSELTSGTTRYTKKEILEALEFYGASYGSNVTHEYATYSVSGLVKDMTPTMMMVCHLLKNSTFPVKEFHKTRKRVLTGLKNSVNNHGAIASRVFREVSLEGTGYEAPVGGTIKSISKIKAKDLHNKLKFFTENVKKKIYIKGPTSIKSLEKVITKNCGWSGKKSNTIVEAKKVEKRSKDNNTIYLVPVPKANQAQIRIGRYLTGSESSIEHTAKEFASRFLGGGFTSRLMQELRVKRGLTYSAGAYSSGQKMYGRSGINTFTKNETIVDTLKVIREVIKSESTKINPVNYNLSKRYLKGNYLFKLESSTAFLSNLLFFDHIGRAYKDIYKFPSEIDQVSIEKLSQTISELYNWDNQIKVIVGSKALAKPLRKAGYKVKILNYKKYL
jgi:zinc protease